MPKKTEKLHDALKAADASSCLINEVIESGYYLRDWADPFSGTTWQTVSDMMYGNWALGEETLTSSRIWY